MSDTTLPALLPSDLDVRQDRGKAEKTATWMANEWQEAKAEIERLARAIHEQAQRVRAVFNEKGNYSSTFMPELHYHSNNYNLTKLDKMFDKWRRDAWRVLVEHLGVKSVMSVAARAKFEHDLERGELPEIGADAILGIVGGLAAQAKDFAREAAKEVFEILRPSHPHFGGQYKTNDAFRVGKKVILCWYVERGYQGAFRVNYTHEPHVRAIDGIFHVLDGKGVIKEGKGPLLTAIEESQEGRGETDYFKFKCFKNHNLHLEMKRLDLVKELNLQGAGEYVLGDDME